MAGSRSPSFAVRRIVSAIAWTCAELMGSGSEATALSNATFMISIVSGGNDAFEKSFIWNRSEVGFRGLIVLATTHEPLPRRRHGSPPTAAPSASPSSATAVKPHYEEQQYRADGGV